MEQSALTQGHHGQVVAEYRHRKRWSQSDLAQALSVDVRTVQRMESQAVIHNINRRRMLVGLLGIPALLLGLEEVASQSTPGRISLNQDRMSFLEEEMATRWEMYHTGGTVRAARGLSHWTQEIAEFAKGALGTELQQRAFTLLAMTYQLRSCTARDLMDYETAHRAYMAAAKVGQALDSAELVASAMAREGVTLLQAERPSEAISLLTGALERINRLGLPTLRGYALQALSEAYAKTGDAQKCWQCAGLAERILERPDSPAETSQVSFSAASVLAQKGVDAVLLRDGERAITLIDRSLATYDPTHVRGRARVLAQKAEAFYIMGVVDACVETAETALTLANSVGSSKTVSRIEQLHSQLAQSRWRAEPRVTRLGALLSA